MFPPEAGPSQYCLHTYTETRAGIWIYTREQPPSSTRVIDSGFEEVTEDKKMSRCYLSRVVYHRVYNVYSDKVVPVIRYM